MARPRPLLLSNAPSGTKEFTGEPVVKLNAPIGPFPNAALLAATITSACAAIPEAAKMPTAPSSDLKLRMMISTHYPSDLHAFLVPNGIIERFQRTEYFAR